MQRTRLIESRSVMVSQEQFFRYKQVQEEGRYNMLDPRAQQLTGLSREVYLAIIDGYEILEKKYCVDTEVEFSGEEVQSFKEWGNKTLDLAK